MYMSVTIFDHFRPRQTLKVSTRHSLRTDRVLCLAMRAKVRVATSTFVALLIQWQIRMSTDVKFVQRSMTATTRRSFSVVISRLVYFLYFADAFHKAAGNTSLLISATWEIENQ